MSQEGVSVRDVVREIHEAMVYDDEAGAIEALTAYLDQETAALRERLAALLESYDEYAEAMGPACEEGCPSDDTCECSARPMHDRMTAAIAGAEAALASEGG